MTPAIYSPEAIEEAYQRSGNALGWRFLTSPAQNLQSATTALVTVNPGGSVFEESAWSVEAGSAYELESWAGYPAGRAPLQMQVQRMLALLPVRPADVLSGYLVPFRSPDIDRLAQRHSAYEFGARIWRHVFEDAPQIRLILAFGLGAAATLAQTLQATSKRSYSSGWGKLSFSAWEAPSGRRIVGVPHLSRFAVFGRAGLNIAEQSFRQALETAGVEFIPENGGGAGVRLRKPGVQAAAPGFAATIGGALDTLREKAAPREVGPEDEARGGREVADE